MKIWSRQSNCLFLGDMSGTQEKLERKVYTVEQTPTGQLYLKEMFDKFVFDFKVYGMQTAFISRVLKTYHNTKGNLGVLLNGVKGTGKTITAEELCNILELPVILINQNFKGLNNFLSDICEDVTILIDEYEKVFKGSIDEDDYGYDESTGDPTLLSIMDGVYKTQHRKIFILTTNKSWLNENMINRPGRIRYVKNFGDLNLAQINEIIDDCLKNKSYREEVVNFLKPLRIITVDIVKSILSEVNIHDESPFECCKDFNVEMKDTEYDIVQVKGQTEKILHKNVDGRSLNNIIVNKRWRNNYLEAEGTYYYIKSQPDFDKMVFKVNLNGNATKDMTIRIKKCNTTHQSFVF